MRKFVPLVTVLAVVLIVLPACTRRENAPARTEAEAYEAAKSAYHDAETPEAKAAIAESYLKEFPDGKHARSFAWVVAEYRGNELGQKEQAYETLTGVLEANEDPARRLKITLILAPLARDLGRPVDLAGAVAALEKERPLNWDETISVLEEATAAKDWDLVLARSEAALALATPEACAASRRGKGKDEEALRKMADSRASEALAYRALALASTGNVEEAEALFAAAMEKSARNYVGLPTSPAASFRGRIALEQQDWDRALELLAPLAIMGGDAEAMRGVETAWRGKHGSTDGLEEWLWTTRQQLARPVDDFTLADYEGNDHTLSKELGKVTLLAFWFPT